MFTRYKNNFLTCQSTAEAAEVCSTNPPAPPQALSQGSAVVAAAVGLAGPRLLALALQNVNKKFSEYYFFFERLKQPCDCQKTVKLYQNITSK